MGYYSSYTLTAFRISTNEQIGGQEFSDIAESIRYFPSSVNRDDNCGVFDDINDGYAYGHSKWYGMEECLEEASLLRPGVALVLDVEGEDNGDVSRIVANNGTYKSWQQPVVDPPNWEDML